MKQLTELNDGQKVLIEASVKTIKEQTNFPNIVYVNNGILFSLTNDLKESIHDQKPITIYDFNEVMNQGFTPEVGKEYEFSNDKVEWYKEVFFHGYTAVGCGSMNVYNYIRPIQTDPKEAEAIEYLKSKGYKIEKI